MEGIHASPSQKAEREHWELGPKFPGEVFSPGFVELSTFPKAITDNESTQEQILLVMVVGDKLAPLFIRLSGLSSGDGRPGARVATED